jgi:tetratricopeptide (TPR) repeat protein
MLTSRCDLASAPKPSLRSLGWCCISLALLACQPSQPPQPAEDTPPAPEPAQVPSTVSQDPDPEDELARLLEHGRMLTEQRRYLDAQKVYERAARLKPDMVEVQQALAWSALHAGNLKLAQTAALASLTVISDEAQRSTSLYYLGRIAEQRPAEERPETWEQPGFFYYYALMNRDQNVVRSRLAQIDPEQLRLFDTLRRTRAHADAEAPCETTTLYGPHPSLSALCDQLRGVVREEYGVEVAACRTHRNKSIRLGEAETEPGASILDLSADTSNAYYLAFSNAGGWYARHLISVHNPDMETTQESVEIRRLEFAQAVPGKEPEVVAEIERMRREDRSVGGLVFEERECMTSVCSLSAERPGCFVVPTLEERTTALIERGFDETPRGRTTLLVQGYALKPVFSPDGNFHVQTLRGKAPRCVKDLLEPQPLVDLINRPRL